MKSIKCRDSYLGCLPVDVTAALHFYVNKHANKIRTTLVMINLFACFFSFVKFIKNEHNCINNVPDNCAKYTCMHKKTSRNISNKIKFFPIAIQQLAKYRCWLAKTLFW